METIGFATIILKITQLCIPGQICTLKAFTSPIGNLEKYFRYLLLFNHSKAKKLFKFANRKQKKSLFYQLKDLLAVQYCTSIYIINSYKYFYQQHL